MELNRNEIIQQKTNNLLLRDVSEIKVILSYKDNKSN